METNTLIATATTHESKVNLFRALTNASPFSEAVNKTLSVVQIIDQPAVNDQGEPVNRYFFLCEDGSAYMSMALGVTVVSRLFGVFGGRILLNPCRSFLVRLRRKTAILINSLYCKFIKTQDYSPV